MEADGTPKIADFGLAKALNVQSGLTQTDSILGSPSYMAPEQAGGHAKDVGPAADVYALGAILYELLDRPAAVQGRHAPGDAGAGQDDRAGLSLRGWCRACRTTSRRSA